MKKFLSTFLMITILLSFSSCSQQSTIQSQSEITEVTNNSEAVFDIEAALNNLNDSDRAEIQTALDRDIASADLLVNLDTGITKEQMLDLIDNCLAYLNHESDFIIENQIEGDGSTILSRDDAAKLLIYAMTEILEIYEPNGAVREYAPGPATVENYEKTSWLDHYLLIGQYDLTNGLPIMESDSEYRFHSTEMMTKLDAIKSVSRLSNSILPEPEYIDINSLSETINFSHELISSTKSLPDIDPNNLPFTGIDLSNKTHGSGGHAGSPPMFVEPDIALLKEIGFNFVRVPISVDMIYNQEDFNQINMVHLRNMDELVEWGMKYQVHICFTLFLWDPNRMESLVPQFWKMMTLRYANVPANMLSFNIINEPYDRPSYESLISIYDQSIDIIHSTSPDRLIFVDSLPNNDDTWYKVNDAWYPMEEMVNKNIILTYHFYQPESVLGILDGYPPQNTWPFPFVNDKLASVEEGGEPLIIEGDFPMETKLIIRTNYSDDTSGLLVKLDGNVIYDELLSEPGFETKSDSEITFPDDGNTIEIFATGSWQKFSYITIIYPELAERPIPYFEAWNWAPVYYSDNKITHIIPCRIDSEGFHHSHIIIDDEGIYHTEGDGLLEYNKEYFDHISSIWQKFKEETQTPVMMQEITMYSQYPTQDLYLGLVDDFLTSLEEHNISWSTWDWERLMQTSRNYNESNTTWIRMGNHYVNKELLEVLQKHINN